MRRPRASSRALALAAALGVGCGGSTPAIAVSGPQPHPAAPASRWPRLVSTPAGRLVLTWLEPRPDSGFRVRVSTRDVGLDWSAPSTVSEGGDVLANWADMPTVIPLDGGALAAQWPVRDRRIRFGYAPRVATSRDGGATWSPPVNPVSSLVPAEYAFATLIPAGGDSVEVAWLDGRGNAGGEGGDYALWTAIVRADGTVGPDTSLDLRTCSCCPLRVARGETATLLSYRDRDTAEVRDIRVARRVGGRWAATVPVHVDRWRIPGCPVNGADLAARGDTVAAVWFTAPGDRAQLRAAWSRDAGATWGPPVTLDADAPLGRVAAALDRRGHAVVAWLARADAGRARLRLARLGRDGRMTVLGDVATVGGGRVTGFPQLAIAGDTAWVAWTASDAADLPAGIELRAVALPR